ncbi:PVC-type heme-binding CxxCH protein [Tundrisphaera lichenicola]|uniref:PVC-type heme-binding CxxCH protein n=1 Tax=Tundrisphaera lichenicola TaxID=2029860 RepID=UPI003EB9F69D
MHRWIIRAALAAFALSSISSLPARAEDELYKPQVAGASPEAAQAIQSIRLAPGLKIELFAAEPLLANPVAFCIDDHGRFFVAETFRLHAGVTDNRSHMNWLDADMASRTVADRVAMYEKFLSPEDFKDYQVEHERVRRVVDADGDGKADTSTVFADGFKEAADGIGAGLLARKGDVYYTCIPDLWKLRDTDGDGKSDVKDSLSTGYGVHVAFLGHDLHGLQLGPDGRLYFSIGDRGLNVTNKEGVHLFAPDTGSVLRCEPDGSNLEIFASGLRNPQELAFDNFGNLFTGDNNSDGGDKARWVHVVEAGDSGWRMGYQYLDFPTSRGPWNAEKLWYPRWEGQAAYIVPPILNISDGPSGLAHDPGTGLPEQYRDHFFLADFRGGAGSSGIRSFANKPKGASFELVDAEQFAWSVLATDVDFGPDGAVYVSDWVNGWNKTGKGRIWKITGAKADPRSAEVKSLIAEGMEHRPVDELAELLGHDDQRIRQEAQFELAGRSIADPEGKGGALATLRKVAASGASTLARVHAIWGLGQVDRKTPVNLAVLGDLARDQDPEIRAQVARVIGDIPPARLDDQAELTMGPLLLPLVSDENVRVRYFAAIAIGKQSVLEGVKPLLDLLRSNDDQDPTLRHAAVMGLVGIADLAGLKLADSDPSPAVRRGVVVALRRLARPEVSSFLEDKDPGIATEAGLAIYEAPIPEALPALAKLAEKPGLTEALSRRSINAANRVGRPEDASALASVATRPEASKNLRVEALSILATWAKPSGRDRINGLWRPIEVRDPKVAADALRPVVDRLLVGGPDEVRREAIQAVAELGIREAGPTLLTLVVEGKARSAVRVDAIQALEKLNDPRLNQAVEAAVASDDGRVRSEGLRLLARLDPARAIPIMANVMETGSAQEKQKALEVLGSSDRPEADAILAKALDRQVAKGDNAIELELIDAASKRKSSEVAERLARLEQSLPKDGPLAGYHAALEGGDRARGRKIYQDNTAVYCVRCHKVRGEGGEVGPELTGIGTKHPRTYLLESIVAPNQAIAEGFESVVVAKTDGTVVTGVLKSEDDKTLRLMTAEAKLIEIPKAEIEERKRGGSAMPEDLYKKLSKSELRDLVEFLAGLK